MSLFNFGQIRRRLVGALNNVLADLTALDADYCAQNHAPTEPIPLEPSTMDHSTIILVLLGATVALLVMIIVLVTVLIRSGLFPRIVYL